ncbi:protein kinase [Streptomyces sp. NPDC005907]|uniref:protein kinase n=1 Tax=Streptomyces sp. NPDC005907 TaxID=3154571 RepID=UPI0033F0BB42
MDDYAGRVLADRYRLPLPPSDEYELAETRAFDTYSGQEVLVRQVPLPEVVEAEVLDADGLPEGFVARDGRQGRAARAGAAARTTRRPAEPAVRRAIEAAQAAAQIPDHPRLDQVFDVFAEGGSLWVVSELVAARPLSALLAEKPLTPYRAAEVASDVLMALRVLHAHGWVHRNITARTVLVCDDGRVMLSGLAVGAAEEALCGYDPVPPGEAEPGGGPHAAGPGPGGPVAGGVAGHSLGAGAGAGGPLSRDPEAARRAAIEAREKGMEARAAGAEARAAGRVPAAGGTLGGVPALGGPAAEDDDVRAARAGAIAAYRAGARAAARVQDEERDSRAALPAPRPTPGAEAARRPGHGTESRPTPGHTTDPGQVPGYGAGSARDSGYGADSGRGSGYGGEAGRGSGYGIDPERDSGYGAGSGRGSGYGSGAGRGSGYGASGQGAGYGVDPGRAVGRGAEGGQAPGYGDGSPEVSGRGGEARRSSGQGVERVPGTPPPGQIADPYGVGRGDPWHGAAPRNGPPGQGRAALPGSGDPARTAFHDTGDGAPVPGPAQGTVHEFGAHGAGAATPVPAKGVPQQQARRQTPQDPRSAQNAQDATRWDHPAAATAPRRGPATALAAERARQARMTVVGPVTERWAPEQAGPVHENWQLAAPIGPATDLWALGALLFRAVQGHAPYPEENTAELVQLVCAEPPAYAEECGPLRPVVESLLRQDPTERLDFEDLRGWLRSLVRSAPEPEAGAHVIAAPPVDPRRLPIVRRRGELVRRRRAGLPATSPHARHKRAKQERSAQPRKLGRNLVVLVLLLLAAAVAYAVYFMPGAETTAGPDGERTGASESAGITPDPGTDGRASSEPRPDQTSPGSGKQPSKSPGRTRGQTSSDPDVAQGFTVRKDAEGFRVAVARGWDRSAKNGRGQVVYAHGDFQLIVVPGRDGTDAYGGDPMAYQREKERELQPFRDSTWATSSGMRTIDVGGRTMAEGQFTWTDGEGRELFVRNLAMIVGGRYHVVQVRGPEAERDEVTRLYEQASSTYRVTG